MAELLAPAGSLDNVLTAIDAGADGMLFWGLGDGYNSYRQWDECNLYDHNRDRKPAFDGVLEVLMQKFPVTE